MKRINYLRVVFFELLVIVVFPDYSFAVHELLRRCLCSSSTELPEYCRYNLNSFVKSDSNSRLYPSVQLIVQAHEDFTNFEYTVIESNDEKLFKNDARKTNIVFFFDKKLMIYATDKPKILYYFNFEEAARAIEFSNLLISVVAIQYQQCAGNNSYFLGSVWEREYNSHTLTQKENNYCIFKKIHGDNVTTYMIRSMAETADEQSTLTVFRSTDYELKPCPADVHNKLEFNIFSGEGEILYPTYVIETFEQTQGFFTGDRNN